MVIRVIRVIRLIRVLLATRGLPYSSLPRCLLCSCYIISQVVTHTSVSPLVTHFYIHTLRLLFPLFRRFFVPSS
jgi:hypothetical protein